MTEHIEDHAVNGTTSRMPTAKEIELVSDGLVKVEEAQRILEIRRAALYRVMQAGEWA